MANRRMISSDLFDDEFSGNLPYFDQVLWVGLITATADDQGRMLDNPAIIRAKVFPYKNDVLDSQVESCLSSFIDNGCIVRYVANSHKLIQITNWWKHQKPSWANKSNYPAPVGWVDREKYHAAGNKVVTKNWDSDGGYVEGYVAGNQPMLDSAIDEIREDKIRVDEDGKIGEFSEWEAVFTTDTAITFPGGTNPERWFGPWRKMREAGATPQHMHRATMTLLGSDKYTITSPQSVLTATLNEISRERAKSKSPAGPEWSAM